MQMLNAQTMTDSKIEYDENFNPIVNICLKNDASTKTITTAEVLVQYGTSDPYDQCQLQRLPIIIRQRFLSCPEYDIRTEQFGNMKL